jgi:TRAP-type transport system periplasmic protein
MSFKATVLSSALAATLTLGAGAASAQTHSLRYFGAVPPAHDVAKIIIQGFDRVRERSGGRLDISYTFYGETPYRPAEGPTLLRDGLVDLTEWLPAYAAGTYPMLTGPELPFAAADYVSTAELHDQSRIAWENPMILEYETNLLAQHDAVRVTRLFYEPMNMWFRVPLTGHQDMAGLRIRAISPEQAEFISAMGATPITLSGPEIYSALQRGLVDGVVVGASAVESFRLIEVVETGFLMNLQLLSTGMLASRTSLARLPEDLRAIFHEEMDAVQAEARVFMIEQEGRDIERFAAGGMTIVRPSEADYHAMREVAVSQVWTAWATRAGEGSQAFIDAVLSGGN